MARRPYTSISLYIPNYYTRLCNIHVCIYLYVCKALIVVKASGRERESRKTCIYGNRTCWYIIVIEGGRDVFSLSLASMANYVERARRIINGRVCARVMDYRGARALSAPSKLIKFNYN